jgi:hypothetical protein
MVVTAFVAQSALTAIIDGLSAARDHFADKAEDEAVVVDAATIAAMLLAGPLAPVAARLAPYVVAAVFEIMKHNTQGRPGSMTPMPNSGARGNAGGGGRIVDAPNTQIGS